MRRPEPIALAVLGVALTLASAGVAQPAHDDARSRLEDVRGQLEQSRGRNRELEAEAAKLARGQAALAQKRVTIARRLHAQEDAVSRLEERLDELLAREQAATERLRERRTELVTSLAGLAKLSRQPAHAVLLAPGSAADTVRAAQLVAATVPAIEHRARTVRQELADLADLRRAIAAEQTALGPAIAALNAERAELETVLRETAARRQAAIAEQHAEARRAAALAATARDLSTLVDRLAAEERRQAAEDAAAGSRVARLPPPPAGADSTVPLPARGRIVGRFGEAGENGATLRGIRIQTRAGAQVVSPADGKIVFAGPFRGYGQLLIIASGGGYHVLLAGFERIDGVVGQWTLAGEPVGRMGNDDASKPTLYVEVRQKGEPINPLSWLAAGQRKVNG